MLQWINDRMKVFGWLFILPLAVVFAVWGVQGIVSFTNSQDRGLKVNGQQVSLEEMRLAYQQRTAQLARAFPEEIPADIKKRVQDGVVDEFTNTALIEQKVASQRYAVTDADVVESIKGYEGFQVGGQFNKDAYYALLKARGYTPERFEAEQKKLLKTRALEGALFVSGFATPQEIARAAALKGETRELTWAQIPVAKYTASAKPDEAAVKAYYDGHPDEFKTPDTVKLSYLALRVTDIAQEVAVDDAALKAYYDTIKERYIEVEKRHARHILIQSGSDDAAAEKKAKEIYAEAAKPGADFAALAKKYSQDAGSAAQGGDLGTVEKSFFVGPFGDALFAMQAGEVKGPVKTQFGWHVIKLEEIVPGKSKSFEEVKATIEPDFKRTEAERRFGERQEKLEQLAFENSGSLEPVAKALKLKIEEVPSFHAGLADSELAANAKVMKAAFSADVLGGQNSRPIELRPGNVVVLRASDHRPPVLQPLEAVKAQAEAGARKVLAAKQAVAAAEQAVKSLSGGEKWDAVVKSLGGAPTVAAGKPAPADALHYEAAKYVGRAEAGVPAPVLREAFRAKVADGKPVVASSVLPTGDVVVYTVTGVKPGQVSADPAAERRTLAGQISEGDIATYIATMRKKADIHLNATAVFE
jgi:peptidyl-prolyl cis-trans isomerase D